MLFSREESVRRVVVYKRKKVSFFWKVFFMGNER